MILLLGASRLHRPGVRARTAAPQTGLSRRLSRSGSGLHPVRRAAGISQRQRSRRSSSTPPVTPANRTWTPAKLHKADTLAGQHACCRKPSPTPARRPAFRGDTFRRGCIFSGAKVTLNGQTRAEKDLTRPELRALVEKSPQRIHGFTETDTPNFSFRDPPCSFYSGTKALGEEAIAGIGQSYIWRLRIPFDEFDSARNYLSKVQRYAKVYDNVNSISHRARFCAGVPRLVGTPRAVRHLQRDQSRFCHDAAGRGVD